MLLRNFIEIFVCPKTKGICFPVCEILCQHFREENKRFSFFKTTSEFLRRNTCSSPSLQIDIHQNRELLDGPRFFKTSRTILNCRDENSTSFDLFDRL